MTEKHIEKILSYGPNAVMYNQRERDEFISAYKYLYGLESCSVCAQELYNKFFELKKNYKQKLTMAKQKYTIKSGVIIDTYFNDIEGVPMGHFTADNITDEVAKKFIKAGYHKDDFILNNQDEEDGDDEGVDSNGDGTPDFTVGELKAKAKEAGLPGSEWGMLKKADLLEYAKSHNLI